MATLLRPTRALFRFSGADAQKLLFDVVTGRLLAEPGPPLWWALLSPQGKIQAEGLSSFEDGAFLLDVDVEVADAFLKRMRMYKLRAAVEIEDLRQTHRVGWTEGADLQSRVTGTFDDAAGWLTDDRAYQELRISEGVAEQGPDFLPDTVFPHDIGMDLRGGVDFKKGCYVGQEVVSRMQHRGTARRRPVIVSGLAPGATPGLSVVAGGRDAGTAGLPLNGRAVAIVRLDRVTNLSDITVDGAPVTLTLPTWATYQFGESAAAE